MPNLIPFDLLDGRQKTGEPQIFEFLILVFLWPLYWQKSTEQSTKAIGLQKKRIMKIINPI